MIQPTERAIEVFVLQGNQSCYKRNIISLCLCGVSTNGVRKLVRLDVSMQAKQ